MKIETKHLILTIKVDDYVESPRAWRDETTLALVNLKNYNLNESNYTDLHELKAYLESNNIKHSKVYAYIHSSISLSLQPFNCRFDSGVAGYIYSENPREHTDFDFEIESMNSYLNDTFYWFRLSEKIYNSDTNSMYEIEIDSCGGFLQKDLKDYLKTEIVLKQYESELQEINEKIKTL